MQTTEIRYTGPSPARQAPHIGRLPRGEWVEAKSEAAAKHAAMLAETAPHWFEVRATGDEKPTRAAKKGAEE